MMSCTLRNTRSFKSTFRNVPRQCSTRSVHTSPTESTEDSVLERPNRWGRNDDGKVFIDGLPRSATPADILRLTRQLGGKEQGKLSNITAVQIEYNRCIPTGRALVHTSGGSPRRTSEVLRETQMTTIPLRSYVRNEPSSSSLLSTFSSSSSSSLFLRRTRGVQGRAEAAERGVQEGNGPGAGVNARGQDVVVWGLPVNVKSEQLRHYLRKLGLVQNASNGEPACEVIHIQHPNTKRVSNVSKHLIRLKNPSEAQALVRRLHMTYYMPDVWGKKFLLNTRVVY